MEKELLNKGYKEGNNCYWKGIDDITIYFNMDDDKTFTTVSIEFNRYGGSELVLYDNMEYVESIKDVEEEVLDIMK